MRPPCAAGASASSADKRGTDEIMVIGGSEVFAAAMPLAARLEITHVHSDAEGDVTFPPIDPQQWREVARKRHARGPDDEADFTVVTCERR